MPNAQPMWIEITRGGRVESRHRVDVAVCDADGTLVDGCGDTNRVTAPRSASKPIQALPVVLCGAADAFSMSKAELALTCASHASEPGHVEAVIALLRRAGSSVAELECGAHRPNHLESADVLVRAGLDPGPEHNNCSGKHSGFLVAAHHMGEDPAGYLNPDHPVQRRVTASLEEMCSVNLADDTPGIDGCGIPVWAMGLDALATGWARLSDGSAIRDEMALAGGRLLDAMIAEPWYVSGTGGLSTDLMIERRPRFAIKGGAEGVYCAVDREQKYGIALKADDGASRAAEVAIAAVIARVLGEPAPDPTPVTNAAGTLVGERRAVV